ncbi:bifunctional 4-hydroxy-2-oxoglutarate aldolase/2-dehydro-3-deoxy-phosphogluconate aldolase [Flaviaesturariibacter flavus]|uniref:Bifunctional 4-hydroxy-2-oxoglutarate aldolase/2-dehydro-3-deoxy-phosphogluconate aldolase n=1 Tax=Flaviaesturariibacter flavus TaxID=2502780 RepID=A0A4R1BB88_9BACT|nr:bifunctional 4-hydroxy-2-oxoglutarate aldolase/2-dehydro-3-deoxy-phosphogluconate aldolase [Flaviaesturariibacter flavus]TCJ14233.1 bifunctional 4-hydroxy-2-oxoglutarate aldolase/2-dehydro-3-deoxy-phosphogluconate aldolase [Flaviaesturariibacter flavus]
MPDQQTVRAAILEQKLLPLYYHDSADTSIQVLEALYAGGIRCVEYTNRGAAAAANFKAMRAVATERMPGLLLGIGTIKNAQQAEQYLSLGADFIICPSMNADVASVTNAAGRLWIPGCMTPTEIADAENAGATLVKIFPGNILGPAFISAVRDLFPGMKFLVTGGVEAEAKNLEGWFRAGVSGVGMGSKLISKELMERGDTESLKAATTRTLELVRQIQ